MASEIGHDAFTKAILSDRENLISFLKEFLPENILRHIDVSEVKIIPSEQVVLSQEKRVFPNLVVETRVSGRLAHLYIILEHKSYPDKYVLVQILSYMISLYERCLKEGKELIPVIGLILYHGERAWMYPVRFGDLFEGLADEIKEYVVDFRALLVDLVEMKDEELLKKIDMYAVVYAWLYLIKNSRKGLEYIMLH